MLLTDEIIETLNNQVPIPIATCQNINNFHSIPNLIYVSSIKIYDNETIIISDNKFCKTRENLELNPYIAITVYNPETNQSYQLKGKVSIHTDGEIYDYGVKWMDSKIHLRRKKNVILPKAIILVHIEEVYGKGTKLIYINGEPIFVKQRYNEDDYNS